MNGRRQGGHSSFSRFGFNIRLTKAVKWLLIINVAVFLLELIVGRMDGGLDFVGDEKAHCSFLAVGATGNSHQLSSGSACSTSRCHKVPTSRLATHFAMYVKSSWPKFTSYTPYDTAGQVRMPACLEIALLVPVETAAELTQITRTPSAAVVALACDAVAANTRGGWAEALDRRTSCYARLPAYARYFIGKLFPNGCRHRLHPAARNWTTHQQ